MKSRAKTFQTNHSLLLEMLELRKLGWSYNELASRYHKDHTTILHHCQKHNIKKGKPNRNKGWVGRDVSYARRVIVTIAIKQIKEKKLVKKKKLDFDGEKINKGKSYREYLKQANYTYKHLCGYIPVEFNVTSGNKKR